MWLLIGLLLASGYADLFGRFGGLGNGALYLQLIHGIGWLVIVLFGYLYFGLYRRLSRAVADGIRPAPRRSCSACAR